MRHSISGVRRAFPHRILTLLAVAAGLLLGLSGIISAQGGKTLSVRAEGFGTIIDGDVAQAKSRAEADARVRALEKALGVYVEAETLVQNEILLDTAVRDKTAGFIQNYRVLSEGKANAGTYRVEIEAWIVPKAFQGKLKRLLSNASVIVRIPERLCGDRVDGPTIENEVISALTDQGFRVLDPEQARKIKRRDVALLTQKRDRSALTRTALRFLSNIIVGGVIEAKHGQKNFGIYTVRLTGNIRVVEADTANILANKRIPRKVRGAAGLNCRDAAGKAIDMLAPELTKIVTEALSAHLKKNRRKITVEAHGLKTAGDFQRLQFLLKEMAWVTNVQPQSYTRRTGRLTLSYPEKVVYLATSLNRRAEYEVASFDYSTILLKTKP